jgi:aminocarboxymuconate-semialdehyde decarboxylase
MDRAITTLGARGVQICTSVNGRPLDEPEFFPVFERVTNTHDLPMFMHPARPATRADYVNEQTSKYEIWQVLGWPFETSVAMARMVFSGFFEKLPQLRLITHHCGAMIPYFAGRAETLWAQLGSRSVEENYDELLQAMKKPPIEYFRMFYAGIMQMRVILLPCIDPVFVPFPWAAQKLFSVSIVLTAQGFLYTRRGPASLVRFVTLAV